MSEVRVTQLRKQLGDKQVLLGVDFVVNSGECLTLLGPSGCGKTTTLRCVAGLERPDSGEIHIGDTQVVGPDLYVPSNRRNIGMVFQSYALWPHMTVRENVGFPLMVRGIGKAEIASMVKRTLEVVELEQFENRYPSQLSGGQQQRVALARGIVHEPRTLLLDEPLSNLDAKLRDQLRNDLRRIQQNLGLTAIYVTHDQVEALSMSDVICVMRDGLIVQTGSPDTLWSKPRNRYVASFLGLGSFLKCDVMESGSDTAVVRVGSSVFKARCTPESGLEKGATGSLLVKMGAVTVSQRAGDEVDRESGELPAEVASITRIGERVEVEFMACGQLLRKTMDEIDWSLVSGEKVWLRVDPGHAQLLADD